MLTVENSKLKTNFNKLRQKNTNQKVESDTLYADLLAQRDELEVNLTTANMTIEAKSTLIEELKASQKAEVEKLMEDFEQTEQNLKRQIEDMVQHMTEAEQFRKEKQGLTDEIKALKEEVTRQEKQRLTEVTEKERDKIQATEKLRKEMLF